MRHILFICICYILFITHGAQAQQISEPSFVLQSRAYQDSIVLRWVPKDLNSWRAMNTTGVSVKRTNLETGVEERIASNILPYDLTTWKTRTDTTNIFVATAAQCLLGTSSVTPDIANQYFSNKLLAAKEQNNLLAFAAFSADFSTEAANGLAFRYVDKNIKNKGVFSYTLMVGTDAVSNPSYTQATKVWKPIPVVAVSAKAMIGEVQLSWPKQPNNVHFSGYYIERSSNKKEFERISKAIIKATKGSSFADLHRFSDAAIVQGTTYYYRVIGVTSFADLGIYSDVVSVTPMDRVPPPLVTNMSVEALNESSFKIEWKSPKEVPDDVAGFRVLRSTMNEGPYELITDKLLPQKTTFFIDEQAQLGTPNFYSVVTEDYQGNTSTTPPAMGILPDDTPPAKPKGLTGVIDSLGIVSIGWQFGDEEDLRGYRVYRGDTKNQEFIQLTKSPIPGNFYADTLKLNTLRNKIFYKIAAFDNNYNPSDYSEILSLERPDFVAPSAPSLKALEIVNDSVKVIWNPSASEDILNYEVRRKQVGFDWVSIATTSFSETLFIDGQAEPNIWYSYCVVAIDKENNFSAPSASLRVRLLFSKKPIPPLLSGEFYPKEKSFLLQWDLQGNTALKKIVLLRNDGTGFIPYASLSGTEKSYTDTAFFKNGKGYEYKIMTVSATGVASDFSNIVKAQFN